MSPTVLFVAGAFILFITLWGVVMAGGLYATRHQPPDGVVPERMQMAPRSIGPVLPDIERSVDTEIPAPLVAG